MTDRSGTFETREWPIWGLFAACLVRLWLVPLPSSFWVDELVTMFVVRHPSHASFTVAPQVPLSIYYWLPRISSAVAGTSEAAFRFPSMIAMGLALWLVALLAARLIHPRAGWFAVFAALSIRGIDYAAIDARPYALGMAVAAGCLYFLVQWLDSGRWIDATVFVLFAALVWRVHLLYWPFYLVIATYLVVRRRDVKVAQCIAALGATAIFLLPQALNAMQLARGAAAHAFMELPTLHEFEHELHWNIPVICGALAWILTRLAGTSRGSGKLKIAASAWVLIGSWWLCQPVVLYIYSHLTGNSVYVGRYLSIMLPGVALTTTAVVACWIPPEKWRTAAAAMAVAALIFQGHWGSLSYRHDVSDWRAAAAEVNRFNAESLVPVIVPSPFVEARPPAWSPDYSLPGFLYCHLEGYPMNGKPYLFPFDSPKDSPEGIRYAESLVEKLAAGKSFAIYGPLRHVRDWRTWFSQQAAFASWSNTVQEFGDVYVAEFTAKTSSTQQP